MREIKFRAWHTELKKMFSAEEMGEDQLTLMPDGQGFINVHSVSPRLSEFAREIMIPLQYTSLKDKNGIEIYERDVVCNLENNFKGVVYYDKGSFWGREFYSNVDEGVYDGDIKKESQWSIDLDWEVIGNIYENPELIEKAA